MCKYVYCGTCSSSMCRFSHYKKKHTLLYDIFNGCKTAYLFKSHFMRDIFLNIIHSKLSIARSSAMKNVCMDLDMGTPYRIRKRIFEHTYTIQYTVVYNRYCSELHIYSILTPTHHIYFTSIM